jgi:hypothetical protein
MKPHRNKEVVKNIAVLKCAYFSSRMKIFAEFYEIGRQDASLFGVGTEKQHKQIGVTDI